MQPAKSIKNSKIYKRDIEGTPERKKRIAISNSVDEVNEWGKNVRLTKEQLHEMMWDRFPAVTMLRIPREVADRLDINANAKIIYGFLNHYSPQGVILNRHAIAGICGLTLYAVSSGIYDLEKAGLLYCKRRIDPQKKRYKPSYYRVLTPPKRFKGKLEPKFINTRIDHLEKIIKEHFYGIES